MAIDRYTKDEFEAALPGGWESLGLVQGEYAYALPVPDTNKRIVIRSSVSKNGNAAPTGGDSIRHWVEYRYKGAWHPLSKGSKSYTTRVPGWRERLLDTLSELEALAVEDSKRGSSKGKDAGKFDLLEDEDAIYEDTSERSEEELDLEPEITLDEHQQAVVDSLAEGPIVVEAAPGSGKTRTLEHLVAALIESGVDPSRIGVFTFSNKAAAEARIRIARTLWPDVTKDQLRYFKDPYENASLVPEGWADEDPARRMLVDWTCTIHALSFRLLKENGERLKVLSGKHRWEADNLIKDSLAELNWSESHRSVKAYIGTAIRRLIVPGKAKSFYQELLAGSDVAWRADDLAEIYRRYYDYCRSHKLVDFDMMQARVIYYLRNTPSWRERAQEKFDYILVDEAQDTSSQQSEILWALAEKAKGIVYCGDVDQSMYAFRGAVPAVLREQFEQHWGEGRVTRFNLPTNYRSTRSIIETAEALIEHNYYDDSAYLKPFRARPGAPEGDPVGYSRHKLFSGLCTEVANLVEERPHEWFVLSRTRAECAAIHTELLRRGIPAINKSGGVLFGAPHIRKVLAYARLACDYANARDDLEILSEIANVASVEFRAPFTKRRHVSGCSNRKGWVNCGCPTIMVEGEDYTHSRYYGRKAIEEAGGWDGILWQRYEKNRGGYPTVRAKGANDLVSFVQRLERLKDDARACLNIIISDCVLPWVEHEYGLGKDLAENGKSEDLSLLVSMAGSGQSLKEFLDEIESLSNGGKGCDDDESILLGTAHWSKGAERERVVANVTRLPIVPPKQKPGKLPIGRPPTIEEERRLFYVMITRAKTEVRVVEAEEWNGLPTDPSQFVWEAGIGGGSGG